MVTGRATQPGGRGGASGYWCAAAWGQCVVVLVAGANDGAVNGTSGVDGIRPLALHRLGRLLIRRRGALML